MTAIKICGLTNEEDAVAAARSGADFLGFIFIEDSVRVMEPLRVRQIVDALRGAGSNARTVGVFRNAPLAELQRIVGEATVDVVQLHGDETDAYIRGTGRPAIKTHHVGRSVPALSEHPSAEWRLFDTLHEHLSGGTGERFDWSLLASVSRDKPFLLAGGLTPENVAVAIETVRPDGVDVASGVERAPGRKDHDRMRRFIEAVRKADSRT